MSNTKHDALRDRSPFGLRIPAELKERLEAATATAKPPASLNSEIIGRLERSFETAVALEGEIAAIIAKHIESEVQRRLKAIASQIGGA